VKQKTIQVQICVLFCGLDILFYTMQKKKLREK